MNISDENVQTLNLVQAMLGSITQNMRAVILQYTPKKINVYFIVEKESQDDKDEIDEILFEFESLQSSLIEIEGHIIASYKPLSEVMTTGRLVYARKE